MCCNIDAPNAEQTPDDRLVSCSDVTMVIGCTVMMIEMLPDRHLMDRIAWCSDMMSCDGMASIVWCSDVL